MRVKLSQIEGKGAPIIRNMIVQNEGWGMLKDCLNNV